MDTFVDSSWYFLRYSSPDHEDGPFDPEAVRRWAPVDQYVGGVEHAILHLLYSRFFTKVLYDLGMIDVRRAVPALLNQGQVINQGKAMSKSLGNGVDLGEEIDAYGVDAVRLTMLFAGPPEEDIDWADVSPAGSRKFLARAWRLAGDVDIGPAPTRRPATPRCARRPTAPSTRPSQLLETFRFNVAVARLMELVNAARKAIDSGAGAADPAVREAAEAVAVMLSLFAPYCAEDMWAPLGHEPTVALAGWPAADPALLVQESVTCVVQVAGKVRDRLDVLARHHRGRRCGSWRWPIRPWPGAGRASGPDGGRPAAEAGERRTGLSPIRCSHGWPCRRRDRLDRLPPGRAGRRAVGAGGAPAGRAGRPLRGRGQRGHAGAGRVGAGRLGPGEHLPADTGRVRRGLPRGARRRRVRGGLAAPVPRAVRHLGLGPAGRRGGRRRLGPGRRLPVGGDGARASPCWPPPRPRRPGAAPEEVYAAAVGTARADQRRSSTSTRSSTSAGAAGSARRRRCSARRCRSSRSCTSHEGRIVPLEKVRTVSKGSPGSRRWRWRPPATVRSDVAVHHLAAAERAALLAERLRSPVAAGLGSSTRPRSARWSALTWGRACSAWSSSGADHRPSLHAARHPGSNLPISRIKAGASLLLPVESGRLPRGVPGRADATCGDET